MTPWGVLPVLLPLLGGLLQLLVPFQRMEPVGAAVPVDILENSLRRLLPVRPLPPRRRMIGGNLAIVGLQAFHDLGLERSRDDEQRSENSDKCTSHFRNFG